MSLNLMPLLGLSESEQGVGTSGTGDARLWVGSKPNFRPASSPAPAGRPCGEESRRCSFCAPVSLGPQLTVGDRGLYHVLDTGLVIGHIQKE